jgi:hypothetical protein
MHTSLRIAAALVAILLASTAAEAKRHHGHRGHHSPRYHRTIDKLPAAVTGCVDDNSGRKVCSGSQERTQEARKGNTPHRAAHGSGNVCSGKTGVCTNVASSHAGQFQAYINDLEARGATIYYMGGYRPGPCWSGGLHPCGLALDVCQDSRDHVSGHKNCHLPGRQELASIAAAHGLFEGGQWCHGDMGHAQVGMSAAPCGSNLYSAVSKFKMAHR